MYRGKETVFYKTLNRPLTARREVTGYHWRSLQSKFTGYNFHLNNRFIELRRYE